MSNKKKEKYLNIQKNKEHCCANCSQLEKHCSGNYVCMFLNSWNEISNACVLINANTIFLKGKVCFEKYNGKNVKNGVRYYNGRPSKLQTVIKK